MGSTPTRGTSETPEAQILIGPEKTTKFNISSPGLSLAYTRNTWNYLKYRMEGWRLSIRPERHPTGSLGLTPLGPQMGKKKDDDHD